MLDLELSGVDRKFIIDLLGEKRDRVLRSHIVDSDGTVSFPYLRKGRYSIRITEDGNRNSIVDTGNLLDHRQPEKVVFLELSGSPYIDIPAGAEISQPVSIAELFGKP